VVGFVIWNYIITKEILLQENTNGMVLSTSQWVVDFCISEKWVVHSKRLKIPGI
jgi:hypothetical protein